MKSRSSRSGAILSTLGLRLQQQVGVGRHPPAVLAGRPRVDLLVLEGHRHHLELLLERPLDHLLELVAVVLQRPAEVVVIISRVVLVLKITSEPARFALDLLGVAEVDEDAERLLVADHVVAVHHRVELDLGDQVLVVVVDLAGVVGLGMVADDLEAPLEVADLDRRLDRRSAG